MSLQLTLWPQNYLGTYNSSSTVSTTNMVGDSTFWQANQAITITSTASQVAVQDVIGLYPPIVNLWRGYETLGGYHGTAGVPYVYVFFPGFQRRLRLKSEGSILSATAGSRSGVYQLIDGLIPGLSYDVVIKPANQVASGYGLLALGSDDNGGAGAGEWITVNGVLRHFIGGDGALAGSIHIAGQSLVNLTHTFTAVDTTEILHVMWLSSVDEYLDIKEVSITQSSSTPLVTIDDGQKVLDLYNHETIPLTLSIDNFKNMAEKTQSYSKGFNIPATKHNNKIFNSIYDMQSSSQGQYGESLFSPYKITKTVLKEDGHVIFDGYMKLIDIVNKEGESSYNINLFSSSISLKAAIGKKTFNDFVNGFDEIEHEYHKTSIKHSWYGQLDLLNSLSTDSFAYDASLGVDKTDVVKYPHCRWSGTITQTVGGSHDGDPVPETLMDMFRPWIRVKYLFDRIISEAGFSYESDFINGLGNYAGTTTSHEPDFKRLFMDMNWGNKYNPAGVPDETIYYIRANDSANNVFNTTYSPIFFNEVESLLEPAGWDATNDKFVSPEDNTAYDLSWAINIQCYGASQYAFRLVHYDDSTTTETDVWSGSNGVSSSSWNTHSGSLSIAIDKDDTLQFQAKKSSGSVVQGINSTQTVQTASLTAEIMGANIGTSSLLTKRNKVKQWDFIKDILTMFNLMVVKDTLDETRLKIEPYDDIFIDNVLTTDITETQHDWTEKVDLSETKIVPLKLKQTVEFSYTKDDKDYATGVYNSASGYTFGNFDIDASSFSVSSGTEKLALKVFGSTFCTPLFNNFDHQLTIPQIVSQKEDGTIEAYDNKPRILYDVSGNQSAQANLPQLSGHVKIPAGAGLSSEYQAAVCQFSHVTDLPTTIDSRDFNFGHHQIISSMGGTPIKNLFNEYWSPYYDELYHSDTRTLKIKASLSPMEISLVKFYDKILIKNRLYRINKIDYKAGELSNVELILLP